MSEGEYDANIQGINIVFGAVLGFVLADANGLPPGEFAILLFLSAGAVISILYLAHSQYKLFYGAMTAMLIFLLPRILADPLDIPVIPQLQPTLAVWAAMIFSVAIMPRGEEPAVEPIMSSKENQIP
ncbi:hypothetical protein [Qipengyuania sp. MTN3-11]|uniref:hypothetical protein n=1 Tax=Qipengyuania sp. MTN3-11 TaxID=3056557 RepID=UPI0036F38782